jgi:hypothetical protein
MNKQNYIKGFEELFGKRHQVINKTGLGPYYDDITAFISTLVDQVRAERDQELLSWVKKGSLKSARAGVLGYDFVHRLEDKLERNI